VVRRFVKCALVAILISSFAGETFAQNNTSRSDQKTRSAMGGPRRQLATILFTGLGGAILGLSTLSFYGRPQDKLNNIAVGFAVGIIAGTTYVTYRAATDPSVLYGLDPMRELDQSGRGHGIASLRAPSQPSPLGLSWAFEF
jgi:hypothetical protein